MAKNEQSKRAQETHTFEIGRTVAVADELAEDGETIVSWRSLKLCLVYMGTVGPAELPHRAPIVGASQRGGDLLTIEPGGSFVEAGELADHLEHPRSWLRPYVDRGELTVYAKPADALGSGVKSVTDMIAITRDPSMLRAWLAVEQARTTKRAPVIKVIERRLHIYADHSTPIIRLGHAVDMRATG